MVFPPIRAWLALGFSCVILTACAGMYAGADKGLAHIGAVKRGDNLYDVVYLGKGSASQGQRRDLTLLQSAELCRDRGYDYFKAADTQAWSTYEPGADKADKDAPTVTLQVSCYPSADDAVTYDTRQVIDRIKSSYNIN